MGSLQLNISEQVSETVTVKENKVLFTGLFCDPKLKGNSAS